MTDDSATGKARGKRRGWYWPWLLVGLLGALCGINLAMVYIATSDPSFAVEDDYYGKALRWDQSMAQTRANEALGWHATLDVGRLAPGGTDLSVALTDRDGRPLDGASITVDAFHNARAGHVLSASFAATATPGTLAARLPMRRPGLWEFRLRVTRGGDVYTRVVQKDVIE